MTLTIASVSGSIDNDYVPSYRNVNLLELQLQKQKVISSQHIRLRRKLLCQEMDYMATLLGRAPHNPRRIPTSNLPSQELNDVVAVLSDPSFIVSDAQYELSKRKLKASGPKDELLWTLFEVLEAEYAEGWTLGYLLNTKILPFDGKGRDPRGLIGHHVEGYKCDGDCIIILELSDGEDATLLSHKSSNRCARIKMDDDLFWAFHTLDGIKAVPRNLAKKPLLITEAVTGVRKNRRGQEAGTVFGLKLQGMRAMSFLFLANDVFIREDRMCGDVWLAQNHILRDDIRMLHGGDEVAVEDVRERWVTKDETMGLEEDMRGLHGD